VAFANLEGTGLCGMRVAVGLCEKLDTRVRGVSVPSQPIQQEGRWPPLQANPGTLKEREVTGKARAHGQPGLFEAHIQKASMDPTDAKLPLKWRSALPMGLRKSKHDTWVSTGNQGNHEFVVNVLRELLCTRAGRRMCARAVGDKSVEGLLPAGATLENLDRTIWLEVLVAAQTEGLLNREYEGLVNELDRQRKELEQTYSELRGEATPRTNRPRGSAPKQVPPRPHAIMLCSLLEEGFGWMHPFYLVMVMREWCNRVLTCEPPHEVRLALAQTHFGIELYTEDLRGDPDVDGVGSPITSHVITWVCMLSGTFHLTFAGLHNFDLLMRSMYHRRVPHTNYAGCVYNWPITAEGGESLGSVIFYGGHCWVRCDVTTVTTNTAPQKSNTVPCCPWVMPEHTRNGAGCVACGYPVPMPHPMDTREVIPAEGPNLAHSVTPTSVRPPVMLPECERLGVLGNCFVQRNESLGAVVDGIDPQGNARYYTTFWEGGDKGGTRWRF
jgi:hypothetical protein